MVARTVVGTPNFAIDSDCKYSGQEAMLRVPDFRIIATIGTASLIEPDENLMICVQSCHITKL